MSENIVNPQRIEIDAQMIPDCCLRGQEKFKQTNESDRFARYSKIPAKYVESIKVNEMK